MSEELYKQFLAFRESVRKDFVTFEKMILKAMKGGKEDDRTRTSNR